MHDTLESASCGNAVALLRGLQERRKRTMEALCECCKSLASDVISAPLATVKSVKPFASLSCMGTRAMSIMSLAVIWANPGVAQPHSLIVIRSGSMAGGIF